MDETLIHCLTKEEEENYRGIDIVMNFTEGFTITVIF